MRYWMYKDSEISGPFDPEAVGRMGGIEDALFCSEGASGAQEGDWRGPAEVSDLAAYVSAPGKASPLPSAASARLLPPQERLFPPEHDERLDSYKRQIEDLRLEMERMVSKITEYEEREDRLLEHLNEKEGLLKRLQQAPSAPAPSAAASLAPLEEAAVREITREQAAGQAFEPPAPEEAPVSEAEAPKLETPAPSRVPSTVEPVQFEAPAPSAPVPAPEPAQSAPPSPAVPAEAPRLEAPGPARAPGAAEAPKLQAPAPSIPAPVAEIKLSLPPEPAPKVDERPADTPRTMVQGGAEAAPTAGGTYAPGAAGKDAQSARPAAGTRPQTFEEVIRYSMETSRAAAGAPPPPPLAAEESLLAEEEASEPEEISSSKKKVIFLGIAALGFLLCSIAIFGNPLQWFSSFFAPSAGQAARVPEEPPTAPAAQPAAPAATQPYSPPSAQQAAPAAPGGQFPAPEAAREPAAGRDYIADLAPKAIDLVKNHPLSRGRQTVAKWLQYSFLSVPGNEDEWTAGAQAANSYIVQYRVFRGGRAVDREPIGYIFEANLADRSIRGLNPPAKELLSEAPPAAKPAVRRQAKPRRSAASRARVRGKRRRAGRLAPQAPLPKYPEPLDSAFNNPGSAL